MRNVKKIVKEIKNKYPNILTIAGGWHATIKPEETIKIVGIDMAALEEAEETVAELLDVLEEDNFDKLSFIFHRYYLLIFMPYILNI